MEEQQREQRQIITSLFINYSSRLGAITFRDKTLSPLLIQNQDKDVINTMEVHQFVLQNLHKENLGFVAVRSLLLIL